METTNNDQQREYLTTKQVADYLSVTTRTIYRWVDKNLLTRYQIGGKSYFKLSEIIEYLEQNTAA